MLYIQLITLIVRSFNSYKTTKYDMIYDVHNIKKNRKIKFHSN